jgi:hypothetical protein
VSPAETLASVVLGSAAGLLLVAVKRAAIGERPLLASVRCFARNRHEERKQFVGGSRCADCGFPSADLGSVSPWRRTYERRHGAIERSEWR